MSGLLALRYRALAPEDGAGQATFAGQLESQITALLRRGFRAAPFSQAVLAVPAVPTLAVTFDGPQRSVLERAYETLERLGICATVFVPTAHPGREPGAMCWDELAELARAGWQIGSLTQSGASLPELDDHRLREELERSREACQAQLRVGCETIAYPGGHADARVIAAAVAAGYVTGAGLQRRAAQVPLRLNWPRLAISRRDTRARFALRSSALAERLRRLPAGVPVEPPPPTPPPTPAELGVPPAAAAAPATRIAVIVPCFNDGQLVLEAVASVNEPEPVEIVVVDDASTDRETLEALARLRRSGVRVIRHERNRGLPAARMTGLRASRAPYVFPLDADDLAVSGALCAMADRLDAAPQAAGCVGDYAMFGTGGGVRRVPSQLDPYRVAYRNDYPVSSLFRRSALESVGGWQPVGSGHGYEDWNLWMSLAERGALVLHWGNGVALRRRVHGNRMLGQATKHHAELYATLRTLHPLLYANLRRHRRMTDLSPPAKWLYPIVFGWRPPLGIWTRLRALIRLVSPGPPSA